MLISQAFPLIYQCEPATMRVLRNNGYCWGRLTTHTGEELDVNVGEHMDLYDMDDDDAADVLIHRAQGGHVETAYGWLGLDD